MTILSHLRLRHFRNYGALDIGFDGGINVIAGDNGQGKSNLLEAICYLSLLRSFRTRRVAPLKQWGAPFFQVAGTIRDERQAEGMPQELVVTYGEQRQLSVDGVVVEKGGEFINRLVCVTMVPEDIELVKGTASWRRRFLDIAMSQSIPFYLRHLQEYSLALKCRNTMLRQANRYPLSALTAYDGTLVEHGSKIIAARRDFVGRLGEALTRLSPELLGESERGLTVKLLSTLPGAARGAVQTLSEIAALFGTALERGVARDREDGCTRCGPHRDDIAFHLGDRPLAVYGSEGECRLACLAVRFACIDILRSPTRGEDAAGGVVLLVDDVLGELDGRRKEAILKQIALVEQVFVAATEFHADLEPLAATRCRVAAGHVVQE